MLHGDFASDVQQNFQPLEICKETSLHLKCCFLFFPSRLNIPVSTDFLFCSAECSVLSGPDSSFISLPFSVPANLRFPDRAAICPQVFPHAAFTCVRRLACKYLCLFTVKCHCRWHNLPFCTYKNASSRARAKTSSKSSGLYRCRASLPWFMTAEVAVAVCCLSSFCLRALLSNAANWLPLFSAFSSSVPFFPSFPLFGS